MSHVDMNPEHVEELRRASGVLESTSFLTRVADALGAPIELVLERLPAGVGEKIQVGVHESLNAALNVALRTLGRSRTATPRRWGHTLAAGVTGMAGGAFGLASLAIELPITTTVMLRSIAAVARDEGEDLASVEARLACLEVFALGGHSEGDDAAESGYFAIRAALAKAVSEAVTYVSRRTAVEKGAPVMVRLLAQIGSRFNTVVAEKILAQGPPILGAVGGATINMLFLNHFQDIAQAHFTVRRLERMYSQPTVESRYRLLLADNPRG